MPFELALQALRDLHECATRGVIGVRDYDRRASVSRFAHLTHQWEGAEE
jgi:hypothetical protein